MVPPAVKHAVFNDRPDALPARLWRLKLAALSHPFRGALGGRLSVGELSEFERAQVAEIALGASVQAAGPDPMASLLLLMLVEMLGRIEALEGRSKEDVQKSLF
jgi:hypothetical protein